MKTFSPKQKWFAVGLMVVLGLLIALMIFLDPFRSCSVCDRCGLLLFTTNWQLPLTEFNVFSYSSEIETPLSQVLSKNGLVQSHPHHWIFSNGGGNGVQCAIGTGRYLRPAAQSQEFAALIQTLHEHGQDALLERVLKKTFDPRTSTSMRTWSFFVPKDPTDSELQAWINEWEFMHNE
jgi:hypothetical protein